MKRKDTISENQKQKIQELSKQLDEELAKITKEFISKEAGVKISFPGNYSIEESSMTGKFGSFVLCLFNKVNGGYYSSQSSIPALWYLSFSNYQSIKEHDQEIQQCKQCPEKIITEKTFEIEKLILNNSITLNEAKQTLGLSQIENNELKDLIVRRFNNKDFLVDYFKVTGSPGYLQRYITFLDDGQYHPGEDWNRKDEQDLNKSVYPIADGVVIASGLNCGQTCGFGNMVLIVHKALSGEYIISVYAHLNEINATNVVLGDYIYQNEELGKVGNTGNSSGPHFHLELRKQSMLKIEGDNITLKYPADVWPATQYSVNGDNGRSFIFKNYYDPSDYMKFMVAKYTFNTGSSAPNGIPDSSGNQNNGTMYGNPIWKSGLNCPNDSCLEFNGSSSDYINIPDSNSLDITTGLTIEAWIKGDNYSGEHGVILKEYPGQRNGYGITIVDGRVRFVTAGPNAWNDVSQCILDTNVQLSTYTWYHIVATFQANVGRKIYINGVLSKSSNADSSLTINTNPITIGQFNNSAFPFDGVIDEVVIYSRVLTDAEVSDHYNALKP